MLARGGGRIGRDYDPGAAANRPFPPLPLDGPTSSACDPGTARTRGRATRLATIGPGRAARDPGTADTSGRQTRTIWWSIKVRARDPGTAGARTLILRPSAVDNIGTSLPGRDTSSC